jgi:CHAT domain-containing protein
MNEIIHNGNKRKFYFMRFSQFPYHFVIGVLLLTCLLCFDRLVGVSSLAQSNDADATRLLVGRLLDLYQQKDLDKLPSLWSNKSPFLAENKKALQLEFTAYEKVVVMGSDIRKMQLDDDKATLRVVAEMAITRSYMVKPSEQLEKKTRTIELIKEGGIWKVWKVIASETELAAAIIAAKTEEERKALMEKEPELITPDLAATLARLNASNVADQKDYLHALAINQLTSKLAEQLGNQFVLANVYIYIGYIHGWIGTPEKSPELALEYFRKSWGIGEERGYKEVIAMSLQNSAMIYQQLGELSRAREHYQKYLKAVDGWGDPTRVRQALNNLGIIYLRTGNYAKALELQLKFLKISESRLASKQDWWFLSSGLGNIGTVFLSQGNYEQALAYTQRAVEAADKAIMLGEPAAMYAKANGISTLGYIYLLQDKHSLALEYFLKGLELAEKLGNTSVTPKDHIIFQLKTDIGNVFAAQNNPLQAIANYQEALKLAEKGSDRSRISYPLWCLGKMYLSQGDYREALVFIERAIEIEEQTNQSHICQSLMTAAQIYQKLDQPEEARQALARAIYLTEQLREQAAGGELDRQRSFEIHVAPYQAMIDFQVDQKRFMEAFSYAQRAKGRTLLELLQNGRINISKSTLTAGLEQEQRLNQKIVSLNRQITGERLKSQPNEARIAELEEQLKKARLEFEAFQTTLYASHPELKVQRGEIRPVSFDDAADLIPDPKTALLDFIVTEENVHIFVLTKDASARPALNTYTIKIDRKSLAEKVERFRGRMANRDYDFQALSKELYVLLLKPAQRQLQGKTNLIISPDNSLWDLPFQTLLSPELRYLIEDAAISYAPSLSVLREMQLASKKKQAPAKASILALGNPALGTRSKELAKFVKMDAELQPLPEAADQVRVLGRLYGPKLSKVLTDSAAREELVKEQSARYHILHLATHGILNDHSPMYSHVLLSQNPGKSEEDGLLEAWEMMNLGLNADLVVLAACETARGRAGAGEGMIGMSWALFVAGCPRTIVSQWKVEASSTTALMVEFHKKFKTRYGGRQPAVSTAEAMRQAALKVMKDPEYVHPFYWGGFVVVGDGN